MESLRLTLSRRFVFAAAVRLARPGVDAGASARWYGPVAASPWGTGNNYELHVVLGGRPDATTGMLINLAIVKERVRALLDARWEHRFLNLDTPPFDVRVPTLEALAGRLLEECTSALRGAPVEVLACRLAESPDSAAVAWADGRCERELWTSFSAARRTCSPFLSEEENRRLFGPSVAVHGHGYRLRATLTGVVDPAWQAIVPYADLCGALSALRDELDHTELNQVPALAGRPMTTECLARHALERLSRTLPVARVRLWETADFSAEHASDGEAAMTIERGFNGIHRLHVPAFSDAENRRVFGACNNPNGHGHGYRVESTVAGAIDERTGTVADLAQVTGGVEQALAPWRHCRLDEVEELDGRPSTSENLLLALWPRLQNTLGPGVSRVRLWETENNRFALRREA